MSEYKVVTQPFVSLTVLSDDKEMGVDKRYAKDIKISDLKNKVEMMTGYEARDMSLVLLNKERQHVCDLDGDDKMLGFYPAEDGYFVQVRGGTNMLGNTGADVVDPNFKRYEMTEEEYAKQKGTMKEFKQRNKLGQYNEDHVETQLRKQRAEKEENEQAEVAIAAEQSRVGSRCQVRAPGAPTRLGTVMYVGRLDKKPGYFYGIKYDEPLGKNDGSVEGKRYFTCSHNYGGFVKPEFVTIGDFPEDEF